MCTKSLTKIEVLIFKRFQNLVHPIDSAFEINAKQISLFKV
jgi:hypothetical protein